MIVAAHQPHYMPWLGYLDKLAKADLFVVMDDLQYEAQNYQNRQRLKLANGVQWLTVPLERGSQTDRICDKRIDNRGSQRQHWQRRTWLTIELNYRRAPYWERYADELRAALEGNGHPLRAVRELEALAVLEVLRLVLEVVHHHEDVGLGHLVEVAEPRQVRRLVGGDDHGVLATVALWPRVSQLPLSSVKMPSGVSST